MYITIYRWDIAYILTNLCKPSFLIWDLFILGFPQGTARRLSRACALIRLQADHISHVLHLRWYQVETIGKP